MKKRYYEHEGYDIFMNRYKFDTYSKHFLGDLKSITLMKQTSRHLYGHYPYISGYLDMHNQA